MKSIDFSKYKKELLKDLEVKEKFVSEDKTIQLQLWNNKYFQTRDIRRKELIRITREHNVRSLSFLQKLATA